jgi:hypothetical protein
MATAVITNRYPLRAQHALATIDAGKPTHANLDNVNVEDLARVAFDPACAPGLIDALPQDTIDTWTIRVPMREAVRTLDPEINVDTTTGYPQEIFDSEVSSEQACITHAATWFFDTVYVVTYLPKHFGDNLFHLTVLSRDTTTAELNVDFHYSIDAETIDSLIDNDALLISGLTSDMERFFTHPIAANYSFNPIVAPHMHRPSIKFYGHTVENVLAEHMFSRNDNTSDDAFITELACSPIGEVFDPTLNRRRQLNATELFELLNLYSANSSKEVFTKYASTKGPNTIVNVEKAAALLQYNSHAADIAAATEQFYMALSQHNPHNGSLLIQPKVEFTDEVRFFVAGDTVVAAAGRVLAHTPQAYSVADRAELHRHINAHYNAVFNKARITTTEAFSTGALDKVTRIDPLAGEKIALAYQVAEELTDAYGPQFVTIDIGTMRNPRTGNTTVSVVEVNPAVNSGYFEADPYAVMSALAHTWDTAREQLGDGWITWGDIAPTKAAQSARINRIIGNPARVI